MHRSRCGAADARLGAGTLARLLCRDGAAAPASSSPATCSRSCAPSNVRGFDAFGATTCRRAATERQRQCAQIDPGNSFIRFQSAERLHHAGHFPGGPRPDLRSNDDVDDGVVGKGSTRARLSRASGGPVSCVERSARSEIVEPGPGVLGVDAAWSLRIRVAARKSHRHGGDSAVLPGRNARRVRVGRAGLVGRACAAVSHGTPGVRRAARRPPGANTAGFHGAVRRGLLRFGGVPALLQNHVISLPGSRGRWQKPAAASTT